MGLILWGHFGLFLKGDRFTNTTPTRKPAVAVARVGLPLPPGDGSAELEKA